jgi:hypothetical protein
MEEMTISCDECSLQGTPACDDCVVTFLLDEGTGMENHPSRFSLVEGHIAAKPSQGVIVDAGQMRAMRLLHSAGLVPTLRFEKRVG